VLAQDLHCHRALAGDYVRVVVGRDVGHAALGHQFARMPAGIVVGIAVQHYLGAQTLHRLHLDVRGGLGHHDQRLESQLLCRQRHALGMVAGRGEAVAEAQREGLGELQRGLVGDLVDAGIEYLFGVVV